MIILDYRDKRPLYEQVTEKMIHLIVGGAMQPGDKLPSVRNLAVDLSVNPNTIQRAYAALEQEGYIYTITGRGNYVSESSEWKSAHDSGLEQQLTQVLHQVRQGGLTEAQALACVRKVYAAPDAERE